MMITSPNYKEIIRKLIIMTRQKTVSVLYSRSIALNDALNRLLEDDRKNKTYSGQWSLTATIRGLLMRPYKEYHFEDLSKPDGHCICRVLESDISLMSPKLYPGEPKSQHGKRLLLSGLIDLGYMHNDIKTSSDSLQIG